eukprot:5443414-Amphidinium_carterae.2
MEEAEKVRHGKLHHEVEKIGYVDTHLIEDVEVGFPMVGIARRSNALERVDAIPVVSEAQLNQGMHGTWN